MTALYNDYKGRYDSLTDDQKRFFCLVEAKSALSHGIPLPNAATDLFPDEVATMLDATKVDTKFGEVLSSASVQADLAKQVAALTPDAAGVAQKIYNDITSPNFIAALKYANETTGVEDAAAKLQSAIGALATLDPALAEKARSELMGNLGWDRVNSDQFANFASNGPISDQDADLAIADTLATLADLRAGRVGLRLTGNLATLQQELPNIMRELNIASDKIAGVASALRQAFRQLADRGFNPTEYEPLLAEFKKLPNASPEVVPASARTLSPWPKSWPRPKAWCRSSMTRACGVRLPLSSVSRAGCMPWPEAGEHLPMTLGDAPRQP